LGYYITDGVAVDVSAARGYAFGLSEFEGLYVLEFARPVPVALQALDLEPARTGVRVTWSVVNEAGISAYRLLRARAGEKVQVEVAGSPVVAHGLSKYELTDSSVKRGTHYTYTLVAVDRDGSERVLGSREALSEAKPAVVLEQNIPNPFNPETQIRVRLPEAADIDLAIYDVSGRFVVQLARGREPAGTRTFNWSGTGARGERVASGLYVCRLQAGKQTFTRKLVLLR
jgi:hypothetical protein